MFTIPNTGGAADQDQSEVDEVDFVIISNGSKRTGVTSGCGVTFTSGMTFAVAGGSVMIQGATITVGATSVTPANGHATLRRYDLVVVDTSGTVSVVAGTAAVEPVFPTTGLLDGSGVLQKSVLAAIFVPATQTTSGSTYIVDKRLPVLPDTVVTTIYARTNFK